MTMSLANQSQLNNLAHLDYSSIGTKYAIDVSEENSYSPLEYFQLPSLTSCSISNKITNMESHQIKSLLPTQQASLDDILNTFGTSNPDEALDDHFLQIFAPLMNSSTHSKK